MVMSSVGPGTKNDCAGEDQQQFTRPTDHMDRLPPHLPGAVALPPPAYFPVFHYIRRAVLVTEMLAVIMT
jgi:hypothetical protein